MPAVSAVVLTFNNECSIADTLAALAWCDEILVVDSGSTDLTVEICCRAGARVLHHDFAGFGPQKHFAVSAAEHDWVLVVDSDEIVTAELAREIREQLEGDSGQPRGFEIPISLVFMGRVLRFGGEYGKLHLRLFDRRTGNFNLVDVHERVILDGPTGNLGGQILHASYRDIEHYFTKFNLYTSMAARTLDTQGKQASKWYVALRFPISFLHFYICKGLVFDGYPGFVWALFSALYPTVKYMKLVEQQSRRPQEPP